MDDEFIKNINRKTATEWFNIALNEKDLNKEIEYYSNCLKLNPEYTSVWHSKGLALYRLERYEDAIKSFEKAIEINPKYASAWNNKGVTLGKLGKYEDAIKSYEKAIEIDPKNASAWYNKGIIFIKLKQYEKAIHCNDEALKINPELNSTAILQIHKFLKFNIKNNQNNIGNLIKKLYVLIDRIKDFKTKLHEQNEKPDSFVHYTKPSVIKLLIKKKLDIEKDPYFRLYCTKYMNDPDEGKILCTIDKNLKEFYEHEKNKEDDFLTFIGSFMSYRKGRDKLPL